MPGSPLSIVLAGNALVFATAAIVLGVTTVLAFATQFLGKANDRNPATTVVPEEASPTPLASIGTGRMAGHH